MPNSSEILPRQWSLSLPPKLYLPALMKISRSLQEFQVDKPVVLTQGTFDGVHLGHEKILKRIINRAKEINGESVLLTFYPHPRLVLFPDDNQLRLITTLEERFEILREMGLDQVVVLPFTKELSRVRAEEYVRDILVQQLNMKVFIIGYDHRFGRNREGSIEDILSMSETFEFEVEEISRQDIEESTVSSSKIRKALLSGDVHKARTYLGRDFTLEGKVVHGMARGNVLGYPTANIQVNDPFKLIPGNGVYAVQVEYSGKTYGGMLNIGDNPTFDDASWSIEVNIFNFNEDIYGQQLRLYFVERMRDELKFDSSKQLRQQLDQDKEMAQVMLRYRRQNGELE